MVTVGCHISSRRGNQTGDILELEQRLRLRQQTIDLTHRVETLCYQKFIDWLEKESLAIDKKSGFIPVSSRSVPWPCPEAQG